MDLFKWSSSNENGLMKQLVSTRLSRLVSKLVESLLNKVLNKGAYWKDPLRQQAVFATSGVIFEAATRWRDVESCHKFRWRYLASILRQMP